MSAPTVLAMRAIPARAWAQPGPVGDDVLLAVAAAFLRRSPAVRPAVLRSLVSLALSPELVVGLLDKSLAREWARICGLRAPIGPGVPLSDAAWSALGERLLSGRYVTPVEGVAWWRGPEFARLADPEPWLVGRVEAVIARSGLLLERLAALQAGGAA